MKADDKLCAFMESEISVTTSEALNRSAAIPAPNGSVAAIRNGSRLPPAATIPVLEFRSGLPLSFGQERLWFLAQMEGGSEAYHVPMNLQLKGELDRAALGRALDRIVERHEALRTVFEMREGEAVQRILPAEASRFQLLEHDLRQHPEGKRELERLIADEAVNPFDLEAGPMIRGRLVRYGEEQYALLIAMHHIVTDAWSGGIFSNELSALYRAYARGEEDPLPELKVQYADYAVWQRKQAEQGNLREQREYWKSTLAGAPVLLQLPTDHRRPEQHSYSGAAVKLALEEELTAKLKAFSRKHNMTLYMTALAGWAAVLARLSGQQDVVIGTPVANRRRVELEGLIGFFVNTLALRLDVSGAVRVSGLLERVKAQAIGAQQHQDIPFEQVVEQVQPMRSLAHNAIFQVMFAWQNAPGGKIELPGLQVSPMAFGPHVISKFDLTLSLREADNRIMGVLEYATSLFEAVTMERHVEYFRRILEGMVADERQEVERLEMLPEWERQQVLYEFNATEAPYEREKCVHELFEEQAEKTPDTAAVVYEDQQLTYAELNRRANRLAHHLRALGVQPDARVAICVKRSLEMVVGLLAILKAGAAYVPLDPAYPRDRLRFMLEDSRATVLLTQKHLKELTGELRESLAIVDVNDTTAWNAQSENNPNPSAIGLTSEHLAYLIYTSGSTGIPKGVMVSHAGLCNYLWWALNVYTPDSAVVSSPLSFDATITRPSTPLLRGRRIRLLRDREEIDELYAQLQTNKDCGLVKLTPALLDVLGNRLVSEGVHSRVGIFVIGGELLSPTTIRLWRQIQPDAQLVNEYGPTESVVGCTSYEISPDTALTESIPIGRPIANTQIYILDSHGQPVPVGVAGELCIGGAGVARGYWNRPELTAERFLPDPFTRQAGVRMYKTGDIGRWLPSGTIEFLGRNDDQVKIRGFRIELEEIRGRLLEHAGVQEAVVVVRELGRGEKQLVAYCVKKGGEQPPAEDLQQHLLKRLPQYMVPGVYVFVAAIPHNANGKVDRKALPLPQLGERLGNRYVAPRTAIETVLCRIWQQILSVERVGIHDRFFELGGHSLAMVRVRDQVQQRLKQTFPLVVMFEHSTVASLAAYLLNNQPEVHSFEEVNARTVEQRQRRQRQREQRERRLTALLRRNPEDLQLAAK
jgi:amino acid adenylation domain-containing protein